MFSGSGGTVSKSPAQRPVDKALMSVFVNTKDERPGRWLICVGKALGLTHDYGAIQDLVHEFYTSVSSTVQWH